MLTYSMVGSPSTVRQELEQFVAATGVDELMVVAAIYDHDVRVHSYELLAQAMGQHAPPREA
jgi:alkanesulfonate monooxygenase SsuD/methylene tetrahydromethanopterin reductase-like flavin-dependent oxidoreductase (luciferase family)